MGVPAFFRWLSRKYASIVVHCVEEKPSQSANGMDVPLDTSARNPNDVEFDNLYLDMNGIIHPCCHPENKPAPKNEDEMMEAIFAYIDRIFAIVRPRKLLYMAIDGVAPRAKMNQQRSRRFRASKESVETRIEMDRIKAELRGRGVILPPDKPHGEHFDSNCITPGTPFMFRLAKCLRYYINVRLSTDPGWHGIKVILSDANVPGEGEHKIMDYIRRQRGQPDHDPNTHHCLNGADADLIMLGLATHEPHFTIIREEFKPNQARPCMLCGQLGHEMKDCQGLEKAKEGEFDELTKPIGEEVEFIFLRLNVLHEYLEKELQMPNLPFKQDIERAIDDWVFMCFFVGNDFLPHLPSLEIREGAIDRLVTLYKSAVYKTGGYITENGIVNLSRVQLVLSDLGKAEDEIFKKRRETELFFRQRDKQKKQQEKAMKRASGPSFQLSGQYTPQAVGRGGKQIEKPRIEAYQKRMQAIAHTSCVNDAVDKSVESLQAKVLGGGVGPSSSSQKRKADDDDSSDEEPEPEDNVKLWEDGWKDRYYENKFDLDKDDIAFRHHVANEYVIGLSWVLLYYYQGCPSWKWYFPYHYAPFASDFVNIGDLDNSFEKNTVPFKPMEQLMSVFPAGSKQFLPPTWQELMFSPESPIIDFYPENFGIDLNGKKFAWQGVALLPFVDETRLQRTLARVYPDLTDDEMARNVRGADRLFVGKSHALYDYLEGLYVGTGVSEPVPVVTSMSDGLGGGVWCDKFAVLANETLTSPLPNLPNMKSNKAISVQFSDPSFPVDHIFLSSVLAGAKPPGRVLKPEDFEKAARSGQRGGFRGGRGRGRGGLGYRPQLGFQRDSHYRQPNTRDGSVAHRTVRGLLGANVAPPMAYTQSYGGGGQQSLMGSYQSSYQGGRSGGKYNSSSNNSYGGQSHQQQLAGFNQQQLGLLGSYDSQQQSSRRGYGGAGYGSYQQQEYSQNRDQQRRGGNSNYDDGRKPQHRGMSRNHPYQRQ